MSIHTHIYIYEHTHTYMYVYVHTYIYTYRFPYLHTLHARITYTYAKLNYKHTDIYIFRLLDELEEDWPVRS